MKVIGKKEWQVTRSGCEGGKWLLIVGRNYRTGDYTEIGWHHADSPKGQRILDRAERINQEDEPEPELEIETHPEFDFEPEE